MISLFGSILTSKIWESLVGRKNERISTARGSLRRANRLRLSLVCLLLYIHIVSLEEFYQGLFDHLALSMQIALKPYGVNLQGFGYRCG